MSLLDIVGLCFSLDVGNKVDVIFLVNYFVSSRNALP